MFALQFKEYGGPEVLAVVEVPEPHAGPGEVRVAMRAASVNPFDWMIRSGRFADEPDFELPMITGLDGAGVVDEVGAGVEGVAVGDEVFGFGAAASAEYAVFDDVAIKPAGGAVERSSYALAQVVELHAEGRFMITIDRVFPLAEAAAAHLLSQEGHVRGKLVLTVP